MSTVALILAALILSGWLYWLTERVQKLLNVAEQAVHGGPQATGRHHARQPSRSRT